MSKDIKSVLVHLSMNMWEDCQPKHFNTEYLLGRMYCPNLQFDEECWSKFLAKMVEHKINMIVLDLGDGVVYKSHPEIAVNGAWSTEKLKQEIERIRSYGIEPIPKMNFSTCHDAWMGIYERMVSTPEYYQVCKDLIAEVAELFETPRFFHIGMDEEGFENQEFYNYQLIRRGNLWWDDLNFYFEQVKSNGSRPWMWSDVLRNCDEKKFLERVPLDVLQSNWYYGNKFTDLDPESRIFKSVNVYTKLERLGYQQVPAASNWANDENFPMTVKYCRELINKKNLLGFMTAPWYPTINKHCDRLVSAVKQFSAV